MAFNIMRISLPVISEGGKNIAATTYNRLSATAKSLIEWMAVAYDSTGKHHFSLDDFRGERLGSWRVINDALFELESRDFGSVKSSGAQLYFSANIAAIQSV